MAGDQQRGGGDAAPDRIQAQCAAQTRLPLRRTRAGDGRSDLPRQGEGLNFNIGRTLSAPYSQNAPTIAKHSHFKDFCFLNSMSMKVDKHPNFYVDMPMQWFC